MGAASIVAGVLYTGGPKPYGYEGLGELFVFLFFGVVAVVGSYFVQTEDLSGRRSRCRCRSACWRRRSSWSTTCATSTPTDGRASARWRCKLGRERARKLFAAMIALVVPDRADRVSASASFAPGCCCRCCRSRSPCRS